MFKISFITNTAGLARAVTALNGVPMMIESLNGGDAATGDHASEYVKVAELLPRKPRKRRSVGSGRKPQSPARRQLVFRLIQEQGVPAFPVGAIVSKAAAAGCKRDAVYQSITAALKKGLIRRVGRGLYQRTGQSFGEEVYQQAQ